MIYARILITAFLLVLAACSAPPLVLNIESGLREPADVATLDPCFRFGLGILSGFDPPAPETEWEAHDWTLLGVKVTRGTQTDVCFVRLTTLPDETDGFGRTLPTEFRNFVAPLGMGDTKRGQKFKLPVGRVLIKCYNQQGQLTGTSVRMVPRSSPGDSLLETCAMQPADDDVSGGLLGLTSIVSPIGASGALKPLRELIKRDVVKQPSMIGLLLGGLRLNLRAEVRAKATIDAAWCDEAPLTPRRQLEFPLQIGGQTMLNCRAIVGPADPPYNLTGGILQFEASNPDHPQNRITVRVLAAKRMNRT